MSGFFETVRYVLALTLFVTLALLLVPIALILVLLVLPVLFFAVVP